MPAEIRPYAYADSPLPIGCSKTISQPFIVALMTDLLDLKPEDRVLEIGTGLGYHAADPFALVQRVYSVEIIEELAQQAKQRLAQQRCANVELRLGNGYYGWPEHAPFDKVMVAAGAELVPPPLLQQLKPGGRMVIPTGLPDSQQLMLVEKDAGGRIKMKEILRVRFSPSRGRAGLGEELAQLGLQHLAVVVLRQRLDEAVLARPLEARDVVEAELLEISRGDGVSGVPTTKAMTSSPHSGCGRPTTEHSATAGWRSSTSSISRG